MPQISFVLGAIATALTQQPAAPAQELETRTRFEQALSVRSLADTPQPLKMSLRDWVIRDNQTVSLAPVGALVVQVSGGPAISATVNGQRSEYKEGQFFVVPAGAKLTLETKNDTIVLTVLEVQQ